MNDRIREIAVKLIAGVVSTAAALSLILSGIVQGVIPTILLASLSGMAGHFAGLWLGRRLMALQKRASFGRPGSPVYAFAKLPPAEAAGAGGKARVLADLYQRGFPVPDGCVLLPSAFAGEDLTPAAWALLEKQLLRLRRGKDQAFAVRSSALNEDSAQASYAGAFESVLNARSDEEIRAAVAQVLRSRDTERVQTYTQVQGIDAGEQRIAVVIQKMVNADYAGVLFTADPLTGDRMVMSGNLVSGLGEKLVSGQVSAAAFTFRRTAGDYQGPDELKPVAKALHREAHEIENVTGCPQDIEWAAAGRRLYILQARPITTLNGYNPLTAEWNDTLKGNFLWSATNLMEACPEVLTPFTASLNPYLEKIGGPALTVRHVPLNGIIGGRFYANISVQVSAFVHAFKGDARRAYREMAGWWGDLPEGMEIPLLPVDNKEWSSELVFELWRTSRRFSQYRRKAPEYLKNNRRRCAEMREKIRAAASKQELLDLWHREIAPAYRDGMIFVVAAGSDVQVRLERDLRVLVGEEDANALLSNLAGARGQLESLGPVAGLGRVARGEMTREEYLEQYGHRGVNEGECAWPRPAEDPLWLDRRLAEWQRSPVDVEAMIARQHTAYQAAWDRLRKRAPGQAKAVQKRLEAAAQSARLREQVRSESTRGMTVLRAFARRAGELLGTGDDVFFLTIDEVLAGLGQGTPAVELIPLRQEVHQRYRALPPYPAVIRGRFDPFTWAADPNRRSDVYDAALALPPVERDENTITGAAGALGVVEGLVRRLDCLEDSAQLQAGEVLVTTMTNIGWTPIFPRAAAIVTDLGAPLSHAAIVARELGIPAVVGCGDATTHLKTGDRVRVDGGRGVVQILQRA